MTAVPQSRASTRRPTVAPSSSCLRMFAMAPDRRPHFDDHGLGGYSVAPNLVYTRHVPAAPYQRRHQTAANEAVGAGHYRSAAHGRSLLACTAPAAGSRQLQSAFRQTIPRL